MKWKPVTEQEMLAAVNSYPAKLVRDVYQVCDPALVTYNDFSLGKWPESVIARYSAARGDDPPSDFQIRTDLSRSS